MPTDLPAVIAAYFRAANAHDPDGVAACFTPDAVVRDEGRDLATPDAIRAWQTEVNTKYTPYALVRGVDRAGKTTVVTATISGTFKGSPIDLRHVFTLEGEAIAHLEIAS